MTTFIDYNRDEEKSSWQNSTAKGEESFLETNKVATACDEQCSAQEPGKSSPPASSLLSLLGKHTQSNNLSLSNKKVQQRDMSSRNNRNRVHFKDSDIVALIPNRNDYDAATKKLLWSSLKEVKKNAKRNRIEFQADGSNWKKCTEEEEMVFYHGHLIHPVTFRQEAMKGASSFKKSKQKRVVKASRILTKHTLRKLLAERAIQPASSGCE